MEVPAFEVALPLSRGKSHRVCCALTSFFGTGFFPICQRSGLIWIHKDFKSLRSSNL